MCCSTPWESNLLFVTSDIYLSLMLDSIHPSYYMARGGH